MEFNGKDHQDAVQAAMRHFGAAESELTIRLIEGDATAPVEKAYRIHAEPAGASAHEDMVIGEDDWGEEGPPPPIDVAFTEEGVILRVDEWVTEAMLRDYVNKRKITGANPAEALKKLNNGEPIVVLAPPQEEGPPVNDYMLTEIARDNMQAMARFVAGDDSGQHMTLDQAKEMLEQRSIKGGIDYAALENLITARRSREMVVIASGVPAQEGQDAKLEYLFRTDHTGRPREDADGKVDYRDLDLFENVEKGAPLVRRVPIVPGVNGVDVRGKVLKARAGKDIKLPRGAGVELSSDGNELLATRDGKVDIESGKVTVSECFIIKGDVDMSVGNVDFTGDLEIWGNVIAGMEIRALGSIEVRGSVEAATIIAGKNVVLQKGMQGMGKGKVDAKGDVVGRYFERCYVRARGTFMADSIYHCDVAAKEGVILSGQHGSLVGGVVRSAKMVAAKTIGSAAHAPTTVEVGVLPEQREYLNALMLEQKQQTGEHGKLSMLVRGYGTIPKPGEPPERGEIRRKLLFSYNEMQKRLKELVVEIAQTRDEIENATGGVVHVTDTAHEGVHISIGSEVYNVNRGIDFATFKRIGNGKITFSSCEY